MVDGQCGATIHVLKTDKGMTNIQEIEEVICVESRSGLTPKVYGYFSEAQGSSSRGELCKERGERQSNGRKWKHLRSDVKQIQTD